MADTLALVWPRSPGGPLRGAVVSSGGAVSRGFEADGPITPEGLKSALGKAGIGAKRTVVALPRSLATVRRLDLPAVPDADLPDLVRMQAATKSAAPLDQLALDFLPLPPAAAGQAGEAAKPGRGALLASVPAATLKEVKEVTAGAGLELASVGLGTAGAARLVAARGVPDGTTLIVTRDGDFAELTLLTAGPDGPRVVHTHAAHPHGDPGDGGDEAVWQRALLAECSRALISHAAAAPAGVARAWAIGPHAGPLAAKLAERFDCEAAAAEDWPALGLTGGAQAGEPGVLAGAVGLAYGPADVPALDFLSPRRRPAPKDTRLRTGLIAAAALSLLLGAGWFWLASQKSALRGQIAGLDALISTDEAFVERNAPLLAEDAALSEWAAAATDARRQLAGLDGLMPGTERMFLDSFQLIPPTTRSRPVVRADGFAAEERLVRQLERDLAAAGYVVSPTQTARVTGREGYPVRFELTAEVPPVPDEPDTEGAAA